MTRTEILLIIDSPMEFFPQRIVGDIYHELHDRAWFKQLTSFEVGDRGYLTEAPEIAAEMYPERTAKEQVSAEHLLEENKQLKKDLSDWTSMYMVLLKKCTKLEKEVNGGM